MAINAGKKRAVNRVFQLGVIEIETDRLAIELLGHRGFAVAGEAVFIGALLLGMGRKGADEQKEGKCLGKAFWAGIHSFEQTLPTRKLAVT
jgi:hypothetical protein